MVIAVVVGLAGMVLLMTARTLYRRDEDRAVADILGMSPPAPPVRDDPDALSGVTSRAVDLAGQVVDRMDSRRSLNTLLERAKINLRPGEFVVIMVSGALALAALLLMVTGMALVAGGGAVLAVVVAAQGLRRRVSKRTKAFQAQLPDALSLVASSLSAGHTFLRAVQMMCEESEPPLSEEFSALVSETRLGGSLIESLEHMAARLQIRDLDMVVQAIRIQQTVGGRLADLFHTLADVIRARDEVKREVMVLTAEGRMSAYVLAGLVPSLFAMMQIINPEYIKPLLSGTGLFVLAGCGLSVLIGLFVILRMVKIDV